MAQMQVNVSWRDIPVLTDALLSDVDGSHAFLRTKAPMPVGTMLIVSPQGNNEVRVPVRVTGIVEVPEAGSAASQGMHVSLEAAAALLEPYLAAEPAPVVGLAPEPAFDGVDVDLDGEGEPDQAEAPRAADDDGDLPAAPRVQLDEQGAEVIALRYKKDSGVMPSASGEISMEPQRDRDPDAPDKVIVMVEAEIPPPSAEPEEPIELAVRKTPAVDTVAVQADGGGEPDAGDEDKPKRKRRGKRRKKKK